MRGYSHLTAAERERIAALTADRQSVRAIAQAFGRSPATISRELRRNALARGDYRPRIAERVVSALPSEIGRARA